MWFRAEATSASAVLLGAAVILAAGAAHATPGSGTATIAPSEPVAAGSTGTWTIDYVAAESFHPSRGGLIIVTIPEGWSPPGSGPLIAPGHVVVSGPGSSIDSVVVNGRDIRVYAGSNAGDRVLAGDHLLVGYGEPAPAGAAQVPIQAPATAVFSVASDPDRDAPQPLSAGSPELQVVPAAALYLVWEPASFGLVAGVPAPVRLSLRDAFGNPAAPGADQLISVTAASSTLRILNDGAPASEIVIPADSTGVELDVVETTVGTGVSIRAADGDGVPPALTAAVAQVTTSPGDAARFRVSGVLDPVEAGVPVSVVVEVQDAFGNRAVEYGGTIGFATTDPGPEVLLPADYTFNQAEAGIHVFAGEVVLVTVGEHTLSVVDRADPQMLGQQEGITVTSGPASALVVSGIVDPGVAGVPGDVVVEARDAYGNRASDYLGTVTFSTSDGHPSVILPADYAFVPADSGWHRFTAGVTLMSAGSQLVAADDVGAGLRGEQTGIDVIAGSPHIAVLLPPGSIPVTAGGEQPILLVVEDVAGNPVPGEAATIAVVDAAAGRLEPDPSHPGGTQGSGTVQSGLTDGGGRLTVRYLAAGSAGEIDSLDGWTATIGAGEVDGIEIVTTASGATRLVFVPATAITDTAMAAIPLTIEAHDSYGNVDPTAAPLVRLTADSPTAQFSVDGGATWSATSADSLVLAAGTSADRIRFRDTRAGMPGVTARDTAGFLAQAMRSDLTIIPAPAAGSIALSVVPDLLTADGQSEAQVSGGPVTDRYGNLVVDRFVTVSTSLGTLVAVDESPAPGMQRRTDLAGRFSLAVQAADNPGQAQISVISGPGSDAGSAAGAAGLTFLPRVQWALIPNTLQPSSAVPGDTVAFTVAVQNLGPSAATLGAGSTIRWAEPGGASYVSALSAPVMVSAAGSGELQFTGARIDPGLPAGQYTPLYALRGTDAHGSAIDTLVAGDVDGLNLVGLALGAVTAPARVARGQNGVLVGVTVQNLGFGEVVVSGVDLNFSAPAYAERGVAPTLPYTLGPRAQHTFVITVDVDPLASLGPVQIDASAVFQSGSGLHGVAGATPATWTVDTAALLSALPGGLTPTLASSGQTHEAAVVVANQGSAGVVLDAGGTRLIAGPSGSELIAALPAPALVAGNGQTALRLSDLVVPGGYPAGRWPARLELRGTENGAPYATQLSLPDSLTIVAPAALAVAAGSMAPDSVSLGQLRSFSLEMINNGGATVTVREGSLLRLSGGTTVDLGLTGGERSIAPGARMALTFGPGEIPAALGAGAASVSVVALTRENGLEGSVIASVPEPLQVDRPAAPRWVGGTLAPDRVTRGQSAAFSLALTNDGEAAFSLLAGSRLLVTDGVHELSITYSGPTRVLAGGEVQTLAFPETQVPADLAAQAYGPALHLLAVEHGVAGTAVVDAPEGELTVEAPSDLRYVRGTLTPDLAVAGQTVAFQVVVENRGGAAIHPAAATVFEFDGFSIGLDMLRTSATIPAGAVDTLFFAEAPVTVLTTGWQTPAIDFNGSDWNGEPLAFGIDLAPDQVEVVTGSALRVVELVSEAPRGARVNRSQRFPFRLRVVNVGEEEVAGATATIAGPGLSAPVQLPLGALAGGDTLTYELEAIAAGSTGSALASATLAGGHGIISGRPPTFLPALDDTLRLAIEREARLAARVAISGPAGAADGVASSGSLLDLEVHVDNQGDAPIGAGGTVELRVPSGYGILGPTRQSFLAGSPVPFAVVAPPSAAARDSFVVTIHDVPLDLNSGGDAQVIAPRTAVAIETVSAAELEVALAIVEPENARAGTALPDQVVTVEARVTNTGTAAVIGTGLLTLTLGSTELTLAPGEAAEQPFTVGETVSFRVVAAGQTGPPFAISARIAAAPPDENTGAAALVARSEATVSLATQAIAAELAGAALAPAAPAFLRGGTPVPIVRFTVANVAPPGHPLVLTGVEPALMRLTVEDAGAARAGSGLARVGPSALMPIAETLARIELRRDGESGDLAAVWEGEGEPVLALADTLAGQETRTYVLAVSVAAGAPAGTYRLELGHPGTLWLGDPVSGEAVPFVLAEGLVESAPLTLFERPLAAPNPFAPGKAATRITYVLDADAGVDIEIFTLYGDRVWSQSLSSGGAGGRAGINQVAWDGRNDSGQAVRNGVYHCRIRGGGIDTTVKIAAIR